MNIKSLKAVSRGDFSSYILFYDKFSDWITIYGLKQKPEATSTLDDVNVELGLSKLNCTATLRSDGDPLCFDRENRGGAGHTRHTICVSQDIS